MARIFTLIKSIDNLDSEYNQKKITPEQFIANQNKMLAELETEVISIGIDNVISKIHGLKEGHFNETPFEFLVSLMYDKMTEKQEIDSLKHVFQYIINALVKTKGTAESYHYLDKAINVKVSSDNKGINQEDFMTYTYEFHKYVWFVSHPGQEKMADIMFKCLLAYKSGHDLPNIPAGVDKLLLQTNLKDYAAQVTSHNQGEFAIVEQIVSLLESKSGDTDTAGNALLGDSMQHESGEQ